MKPNFGLGMDHLQINTNMENVDMETKNVFIATLPRSGSTLMGMILGAHSQVCHIGESAYWSKLDAKAIKCCCGVIGCKKLISISNIISNYPVEIESINTACGMIDVMEEPTKIRHKLSHSSVIIDQDMFNLKIQQCCTGIEKVVDAARVVSGKNVIVENSKYILIANELIKNSREWKIIVLTRDPRGVALSSKRAGIRKGIPRPIGEKINLFASFARRASTLIQQENVLHVRYEDLCRNTPKALENMCDFLKIPVEKNMLLFKKNKGHLLMGNHMMYDFNEEIQEDFEWRFALSHEEKLLFTKENILLAYRSIGYDLNQYF